MVEELIPIVMFVVIGVVFGLFAYFKFRTRAETQQTIRLALEKGNALSPELLDQLANPEPPADRDLRRGLIWLALAVALALCGFFVPEPTGDALRGCLAGASFPLSIGIAYLVMWTYTSRKARQG